MKLEAISNGLGAPSVYLLWLASQGRIPSRVSITADTGSELDRVWSTGEKSSAEHYYRTVVEPLCNEWGIETYFVRAETGDKTPMPSVHDYHGERVADSILMPLFGSRGGRLPQNCTERWKIAAIKQQARRLGATQMVSALGIHYGEAARRVKGRWLFEKDGFNYYRTAHKNRKTGDWKETKWLSHFYPLVDLRLTREQIRQELEVLNIPYLISSECDCCPHQDPARWLRHSDESIERTANLESRYEGEYFFTRELRPLRQVIADYKAQIAANPTLFDKDASTFNCDAPVCDV